MIPARDPNASGVKLFQIKHAELLVRGLLIAKQQPKVALTLFSVVFLFVFKDTLQTVLRVTLLVQTN